MAKRLYLIRHAKSSWDHPGLTDFQRPLNKRGERDAPNMGTFLKEHGHLPDLIITSPAMRAKTTAYIMAEKVGYPEGQVVEKIGLYHASDHTMLYEIIHTVSNDVNALMLFGHNPGMTELANRLTGAIIDNVPTAGIVTIDFATDQWNKLAYGQGELISFDYPKKFKTN